MFQERRYPEKLEAGWLGTIDVDGYILIKVAEPNVWKFKHQLLWESKYGKPKKGNIIQFKDHNKLNCNLNNLEEVSRQVGLYLNRHGYAKMPMALKPTMKAIALVETKISERLKQKPAHDSGVV